MNNNYITPVLFIRKYTFPEENGNLTPIINLTNQIEVYRQYSLPVTYLMQYDALIDDFYFETIEREHRNSNAEVGIWLEIVRPLAEKAGMKWRGRDGWPWDYHVRAGLLPGYSLQEKKKLIDVCMNDFKERFGFFPKTIGAWLIDSDSMQYISQKYNPDIFIICREQWGMDGYTLWGGPYYGAYYPCKNNMLCPAQTDEQQINTPVFRMYVNDPIYCYYEYAEEKYNDIKYGLFTQEPTWMCGQNEDWVKWHYDNTFKGDNIGFKYTQLGQENNFDWETVEKSLKYQVQFAVENREKYGYEFVTCSEMGKQLKQQYSTTPVTARFAIDDWAEKENKSVWFNSKYYRINVFADRDCVWIRDIHLFNERYADKYLTNSCTSAEAQYYNLPIMDGIRFTDDNTKAGMYFDKSSLENVVRDRDTYIISINADENNVKMHLHNEYIEIKAENPIRLKFITKENCEYICGVSENEISYNFEGIPYSIKLSRGKFESGYIKSEENQIVMQLKK